MSDVLKYKQSQSNATLRQVEFTCVDNTDVSSFLQSSDMSTFVVKICKAGSTTFSSPSSSTCTQRDATNAKGWFFWAPNAADFDTVGRLKIRITNAGGTKTMRPRNIVIIIGAEDGSDTATANLTLVAGGAVPTPAVTGVPKVDTTTWAGTAVVTPTTAGVPRTDVHAMEAGVLTATAIASGAFSLATFAADALLGAFGILDSGTAQAGASISITLRSGASALDNAYRDAVIFATSGTGALTMNQIDTGYVGATKVAPVKRAWDITVDNTTSYVIMAGAAAGAAPSAAAVASAVWSAVLLGSLAAGDIQRLFVAVLAGPVKDFTTGTQVYKCPVTGKVRLTITTDATGRLTATLGDLT